MPSSRLRSRPESESTLTRAIIDAINASGMAFVFRHHVGSRGRIRFGKTGQPDIFGFTRQGRFIAFEVKKPLEPGPREAQEAWLARARQCGCITGEVRSPADAIQILLKEKGR